MLKRPNTFEEGSIAWLPDPNEVFVLVRVLKAFERGTPGKVVKLRNNNLQAAEEAMVSKRRSAGLTARLSAYASSAPLRNSVTSILLSPEETKTLMRADEKTALASLPDMISMTEISEAALLHNLRLRFLERRVYTAIGSLLVSVNPFQALSLYTPEVVDNFRAAGSVAERAKLGPHVYGMADLAFTNMINSRANQSCIVSGESGSGKTEFSKLFLQYLMEVSKGQAPNATSAAEGDLSQMSLATKILTATQVLEAFGNASTTRNDNSSRHGKWLSVMFHNKRGSVLGANVQTYLLEKSRLVDNTRSKGERNFHIFYQLLAGAGNDWALEESLQLQGGPDAFRYSAFESNTTSNAQHLAQEEARAFEETIRNLRVLGLTSEAESQVLSILAGLLHLGNLNFIPPSEAEEAASQVSNADVLAVASELLGLSSELLATTLTKKDLSNARETLYQNRTVAQAAEARDALAKFVYSQVFEYVVSITRLALEVSQDDSVARTVQNEIGILDIFGFEIFENNSFEQLLINYANEALQEKFFNKFLFESERLEYASQGMSGEQVDLLCRHLSTLECLKMFEDRPTGMFASLEDEIVIPQSTDATFLSRFTRTAGVYKCYAKPPAGLAFKVQHYAGVVAYDARNFLEKSKDRVDPMIENLALSATGLLGEISNGQILFSAAAAMTMNSSSSSSFNAKRDSASLKKTTLLLQQQPQRTLGSKFVAELSGLIEALGQTQPHFARCIKPNEEKSPTKFTSTLVMNQLRCSGLLDVCRVRRSGFPVRIPFADFAWRYQCLLPAPSAGGGDAAKLSKEIFDSVIGSGTDGFFGVDKVLLRDSARDYLDFQRENKLKAKVVLIQKHVRGRRVRVHMVLLRAKLEELERATARMKTEQDVEKMEILLRELDTVSRFHPTVARALAGKSALERRNLLLIAIESTKTVQEAQVVKREAMAAGFAENDPLLGKINALLAQHDESTRIKNEIETAMETRDLGKIERALFFVEPRADNLSLDAEALRDRLRREHNALDVLERAMKAEVGAPGRTETLRTSLHTVMQMGMETHPSAIAGMKLLKQWKRTDNESRDMSAFRLQGSEDARRALEKLNVASQGQDFKALAEARHEALELGLDRRADVQRAGRLLKQMDEKTEHETKLEVATDILLAKANLKSGTALTARDIEFHAEAIYVAKQWQMPNTAPALIRAQQAEGRARAQLKQQIGLVEAMKEKDLPRIRTLLEDAQRIGVDNDLIRRAKAVASNRAGGENGAKEGKTASIKDKAMEINKLSEIEYEQKRLRRREEARKIEHDWWNLDAKGIVRTVEDFASKKGGFLGSSLDEKAAKTRMQWSNEVIPKSMTVNCGKSNDRLSKRAVLMHKAILGYCGDLVLPFPSILVQQILEAALIDPPLQDELWVQLMKQLTLNPYLDSERRAWMLFCICASCVGPYSEQVENSVLNFLDYQLQITDPKIQEPLHLEFAKYALRKFESIVLDGPSGIIPTEEEIEAFSKRPPLLATICLPDGAELTREMPITPDTTVHELVETCCETYGLAPQNAFMFGLFKELDSNAITEKRTRKLRRMEVAKELDTLTRGDAPPQPELSGAKRRVSAKPMVPTARKSITGSLHSGARRPSLLQSVTQIFSKTARHTPTPPSAPPPRDQHDAFQEEELTIFQREQQGEGTAPSVTSPPHPATGAAGRRRASLLSNSKPQMRGSYIVPSNNKAKLKVDEKLPPRSVVPFTQHEYLGDILAKHVASGKPRLMFVLRRTLVYPLGTEPAAAQTKDKGAYLSISYLDAVEELLAGNWAMPSKESAALFAALIITELRKGNVPNAGEVSPAFPDYVHLFLPAEWYNNGGTSKEEWAKLILLAFKKLKVSTGKECRRALLHEASQVCSNFGQISFQVRRDNVDLLFGCDARGVYLMQPGLGRAKLFYVPHSRVKKVGATVESCSIQIWNEAHNSVQETLLLSTAQGYAITALLWEFGIKSQM